MWSRRLLSNWRAGYTAGYRHGYRAGLAEPPEPMDIDEPAPWPRHIDPALDKLRYPPRGRRHFGEPRPGDYPGTEVAS